MDKASAIHFQLIVVDSFQHLPSSTCPINH